MNIHEHQAKEILKKFNINVPNGIAIFSLKEIDINFKKLNPSKNLKIYDMRNIYSPLKVKSQGFKYFSIGR